MSDVFTIFIDELFVIDVPELHNELRSSPRSTGLTERMKSEGKERMN
jgi:hypothetical protein